MEKVIHLEQKEAGLLQQHDQERKEALAVVGALSLDMEQARKTLETVADRQRTFIRHALMTRGVDTYENARAHNGAIIVTIADPLPIKAAPEEHAEPARLNGALPITQ
jgi:hypothetical protein